jgi:hypothetical protein
MAYFQSTVIYFWAFRGSDIGGAQTLAFSQQNAAKCCGRRLAALRLSKGQLASRRLPFKCPGAAVAGSGSTGRRKGFAGAPRSLFF